MFSSSRLQKNISSGKPKFSSPREKHISPKEKQCFLAPGLTKMCFSRRKATVFQFQAPQKYLCSETLWLQAELRSKSPKILLLLFVDFWRSLRLKNIGSLVNSFLEAWGWRTLVSQRIFSLFFPPRPGAGKHWVSFGSKMFCGGLGLENVVFVFS